MAPILSFILFILHSERAIILHIKDEILLLHLFDLFFKLVICFPRFFDSFSTIFIYRINIFLLLITKFHENIHGFIFSSTRICLISSDETELRESVFSSLFGERRVFLGHFRHPSLICDSHYLLLKLEKLVNVIWVSWLEHPNFFHILVQVFVNFEISFLFKPLPGFLFVIGSLQVILIFLL